MAAMLCRRACSRNRTRGVLSSPAPAPGRSRASCPAVSGERWAGHRPETLLRRVDGPAAQPGDLLHVVHGPVRTGAWPARSAADSSGRPRRAHRPGVVVCLLGCGIGRTLRLGEPAWRLGEGPMAVAGRVRLVVGKTQTSAVSPVDSAQHHLGHGQLGVQRGPGDGTKVQGHPVGERLVPGSQPPPTLASPRSPRGSGSASEPAPGRFR